MRSEEDVVLDLAGRELTLYYAQVFQTIRYNNQSLIDKGSSATQKIRRVAASVLEIDRLLLDLRHYSQRAADISEGIVQTEQSIREIIRQVDQVEHLLSNKFRAILSRQAELRILERERQVDALILKCEAELKALEPNATESESLAVTDFEARSPANAAAYLEDLDNKIQQSLNQYVAYGKLPLNKPVEDRPASVAASQIEIEYDEAMIHDLGAFLEDADSEDQN
ncbi:uncharacterized protein LOC126316694 [Schistocerca gregaria]|uniref:uncharacterized protein LOC126316694 n=1 Tax=Schistocerca gregaria TaxID=7010 RepID=UPI00211EDF7F|nr:uncharacterized protein LOC126316694 [Schistocerca gregaria]